MSPDGYNGTFEDVRTFFCVRRSTLNKWIADREIGFTKPCRHLVFGEADVVKVWVANRRDAVGSRPGEAEALAKDAWREHLKARREAAAKEEDFGFLEREINKLKGRVDALEAKLCMRQAA